MKNSHQLDKRLCCSIAEAQPFYTSWWTPTKTKPGQEIKVGLKVKQLKIKRNRNPDCKKEAGLVVLRTAAVPPFHGNFLDGQRGLHKERNCLITGLFTPAQPLPAAILRHQQILLQWQSFQRYFPKIFSSSQPKARGTKRAQYSPASILLRCYYNAALFRSECLASLWLVCYPSGDSVDATALPALRHRDLWWGCQHRWHWAVDQACSSEIM